MSKIRKIFANNLKEIRNRKDLTQEELAEKLQISIRYVQYLEGPKTPNVGIETIWKLSKAMKVKANEFLKEKR